MNFMELQAYWPFLIPLILADVALCITALVHIFKHPHYRFGNKVLWVVIVLLFQIIGPTFYFVFGRGEE